MKWFIITPDYEVGPYHLFMVTKFLQDNGFTRENGYAIDVSTEHRKSEDGVVTSLEKFSIARVTKVSNEQATTA